MSSYAEIVSTQSQPLFKTHNTSLEHRFMSPSDRGMDKYGGPACTRGIFPFTDSLRRFDSTHYGHFVAHLAQRYISASISSS